MYTGLDPITRLLRAGKIAAAIDLFKSIHYDFSELVPITCAARSSDSSPFLSRFSESFGEAYIAMQLLMERRSESEWCFLGSYKYHSQGIVAFQVYEKMVRNKMFLLVDQLEKEKRAAFFNIIKINYPH